MKTCREIIHINRGDIRERGATGERLQDQRRIVPGGQNTKEPDCRIESNCWMLTSNRRRLKIYKERYASLIERDISESNGGVSYGWCGDGGNFVVGSRGVGGLTKSGGVGRGSRSSSRGSIGLLRVGLLRLGGEGGVGDVDGRLSGRCTGCRGGGKLVGGLGGRRTRGLSGRSTGGKGGRGARGLGGRRTGGLDGGCDRRSIRGSSGRVS